ncbi:glutathione S-transferase family protein [Limimaricola sp. AA108-03]|uniref:glutathione S-transferase family protein n=1 Tax=Limimaricola sp. AA108-03 TaxID=3425945 RepID=UPI003D77A1AA
MLTLYHAPLSRSSRIIRLIEELGVRDRIEIQIVPILRNDGSLSPGEAHNPHPEGKVPLLVHDSVEIWESNAIILYLTDLFPQAAMGPVAGDPMRGRYLSWLAWYGNVVEPVLVFGAAELSHPYLDRTFRGRTEMIARLAGALQDAPFLMGEAFTAADLLLVSPFIWFPEAAPDHPAIRAWIDRCEARPSAVKAAAFDVELLSRSEVA